MESTTAQFETSFDLDTDTIATPVIPQGNYRGAITSVILDTEKQSINFDVVFSGNDGCYYSDGETAVDGSKLIYKIWLPRAEDKDTLTTNGRQTKWQWKVNNLAKVSTSLRLNMKTPAAIAEAINNGDWIGTDIIAAVKLSEWNGELRNEINSLIAG
jgi:hypothetical protein